jgi:hypothetical protein
MELIEELKELRDLLNKANAEFKNRGRNYAEAYKNYRILVAQKLLQLKAEGMPVTIAYDIARGDEIVASAKAQEIIAESLYESCKEAINSYKLQIKILEGQIRGEWNNGNRL